MITGNAVTTKLNPGKDAELVLSVVFIAFEPIVFRHERSISTSVALLP